MLYAQPQCGPFSIDWSNPITRGLAFAYLPGLGYDATQRYPFATRSSSGATAFGASLVTDGSSTSNGLTLGAGPLLGPLSNSSVVVIATSNNGSGFDRALYCERQSTDIYKLETVGNHTQFTYRNDAGTLLQLSSTDGDYTNGKPRFFAATKSGQTHSVYTNTGSASGTFGSASTSFTEGSISRTVGWDVADSNANTIAKFDFVLGWSRTLSDAEMATLRANPWQVFFDEDEESDAFFGATSGSPDVTIALTGQALAANVGTLAPASTRVLSGSTSTSAQGALANSTAASITGTAAVVSQGSVTAAPTVGIVGQSVTSAQGSVTPSASVAMSGQVATPSQGVIVAGRSVAIAGSAATAVAGSVGVNASVTLVGTAATAERGTVIGNGDAVSAPVGAVGFTIMSDGPINAETAALIARIAQRAGTMRGAAYGATIMRASATNDVGAMSAGAINQIAEFI